MNARKHVHCQDCDTAVTRRDFVKAAGVLAAAGAAAPWLASQALAAPSKSSAAEMAVAELYAALDDSQKKIVCLPYDHELRTRINANWHVTKPLIDDDFYTKAQRELILRAVKNATSEDGYERLLKQTEYDDGGIGAYSMAIFGTPDSDKCEFEVTGRHLTLRADGDSNPGAAFGGPIVYGHGEESPQDNLFHYQTKRVNEVFAALDKKQRKLALQSKAPAEAAVPVQGKSGKFPGIGVDELSSDQKGLVEEVLRVILAPYRAEDVDEAMAVLKAGGGLDSLHMAFYSQNDLDNDGVWDIWRVEGPNFVWHFRGAPHVHAYINVALKA